MRNWFDGNSSFLQRQRDAVVSCIDSSPDIQMKYCELAQFHNAVIDMQTNPDLWKDYLIPEEIVNHLKELKDDRGTSETKYGQRSFLTPDNRIDQIASDAWIF
jgi:hypothetical protein